MTTEEYDVDGQAGDPIPLPIAPGPPTGHTWQLDLPEGVVRVEDGPPREVPAEHWAGAAVGGNLQVTAPAGEHEVTARLVRPWEPDQPVRVAKIRLHVL
jgi:predicted secreted protein